MKLSNQELSLPSAKKVLNAVRLVQEVHNKYNEKRIELMKNLADKNKNGEPKIDKNENFVLSKDSSERANEKLKEMLDTEVELPSITADELSDAKLTAQEFSLLEGVIV
jgi:hypothetical protein